MTTKQPHPTKKGPGRRHKQGYPHGSVPKPAKFGGWAGPRTNAERNIERQQAREVGARQLRKARKAARIAQRPATPVIDAINSTSLEAA